MNRIEFRVAGMVCEGCSVAVRKAVTALAGVAGAKRRPPDRRRDGEP